MSVAISQRLVGRRRRCVVAAIVSATAAGLFAAPALGAVRWQITMTHANPYGRLEARDPYSGNSGTFARESLDNAYTIAVKNVGGEASQPAPPVVVSDRLPEGVVVSPALFETLAPSVRGSGWKCKVLPGETSGGAEVYGGAFECERSDTVGAEASYPPITAEVTVLPGAAPPIEQVATLPNAATVAGGGGQEAQTIRAEGETTITPAVPFGIDSFTVHTGAFKLTGLGEPENQLATSCIEKHVALACELSTEDPEFDEADRPSLPTQAAPGINLEFTPFSQAGGHPPSLVNAIALHQVPYTEVTNAQNLTHLQPAGGSAKEVHVEVPPGFIGNVLSMPRCPIRDLEVGGGCPADTAVGFTQVDLKGTSLVKPGGRVELFQNFANAEKTNNNKSSLVYNVQPDAGQPAEFGFFVAKLPIFLEVKLRSDGDYGVTVGTNAAGEHWPATDVTMCENGARETVPGGDACIPVAPESRPFLTNPAECSAPSQWTLQANPWVEPNDVVSASVHTNVEARRVTRALKEPITVGTGGERLESDTPASTLSGCGELSFKPLISFAPTAPTPTEGGTNQADSPTGAAFDLTLPQASEAADEHGNAPPATPALKEIKMKLPAGMTISPSAANGLQACSNAEFWPGGEHLEPAVEAECPKASQIATVETFTPLLSGAPTVSGPSKEAGGEFAASCSEGFWTVGRWNGTEEPELSYQWLRDGEPVKENPGENRGGQRERYILGNRQPSNPHPAPEEDEGASLQCEVIAHTNSGSSVAVSQPVREGNQANLDQQFPGPFPPAGGLPAPSGSAVVGGSLTCPTGEWTNKPEFKYQWLRGAVPIPGTLGPTTTYTLTPQDAGKVVQCEVFATTTPYAAVLYSAGLIVSPTPSPAPPLPGGALQGQLFVGQPECNPCSSEDAQDGRAFRLFIQLQDEPAGIIVKLHGVNQVDPTTGQQETVFEQQPQQPFSLLQAQAQGGRHGRRWPTPRTAAPRRPAPNSLRGARASADRRARKKARRSPATPGRPPVQSSFEVNGCPATMPFTPSFNAGTVGPTATTAGASHELLAHVRPRRPRTGPLRARGAHAARAGGQGASRQGVRRSGNQCRGTQHRGMPSRKQNRRRDPAAGPGPDPFVNKGNVYFTGPYKGGPFGLVGRHPRGSRSVQPRQRGRPLSAITIDPKTRGGDGHLGPAAAVRRRRPAAAAQSQREVNRPGFMLNPTNCNAQQVSATLSGAQGASCARSPRRSGSRAVRACRSRPSSRRPRRRIRAKPRARA